MGFGLPPQTSLKGYRTTSASAFIGGKTLGNLKVLANSRAVKVITKGNRAVGVELQNGKQSELLHSGIYSALLTDLKIVLATKEVILTAGAIDSPRLLLLSGIGPRADLQNLSIPVASDLPGVGESLQDHPAVFFTYHMTPGFSSRAKFAASPNDVEAASKQWLSSGTGPLLEHFGSIPAAFLKAEETYHSEEFKKLPQKTQDLLKKSTVPNFEFALVRNILQFISFLSDN